MTFQDGGDFESGRVKKRSGAKTAGGVGIGVIALALLSQFVGVDLSQFANLFSGSESSSSSQSETALAGCDSAQDANSNDECRYDWAMQSLDKFWERELPEQTKVTYKQPDAISFSNSVSTACGNATSATGPFYCPSDQTVYLDIDFFETLRTQFNTSGGPLAQMYIVAHEVGHHIENQTGILGQAARQDSGADSDSVKVELMADCLAGMWVKSAATDKDESTGKTDLEPITQSQLKDALDAAAAVGDDRIQEMSGQQVNPHGFTHGSAAQRQKWFNVGYDKQSFDACNTFEAKSLD